MGVYCKCSSMPSPLPLSSPPHVLSSIRISFIIDGSSYLATPSSWRTVWQSKRLWSIPWSSTGIHTIFFSFLQINAHSVHKFKMCVTLERSSFLSHYPLHGYIFNSIIPPFSLVIKVKQKFKKYENIYKKLI